MLYNKRQLDALNSWLSLKDIEDLELEAAAQALQDQLRTYPGEIDLSQAIIPGSVVAEAFGIKTYHRRWLDRLFARLKRTNPWAYDIYIRFGLLQILNPGPGRFFGIHAKLLPELVALQVVGRTVQPAHLGGASSLHPDFRSFWLSTVGSRHSDTDALENAKRVFNSGSAELAARIPNTMHLELAAALKTLRTAQASESAAQQSAAREKSRADNAEAINAQLQTQHRALRSVLTAPNTYSLHDTHALLDKLYPTLQDMLNIMLDRGEIVRTDDGYRPTSKDRARVDRYWKFIPEVICGAPSTKNVVRVTPAGLQWLAESAPNRHVT